MAMLVLPTSSCRSGLVVAHGLSARAAERRNSKRRRQQKKAQQEWNAQTQKEQMWYQVTAPSPQPLLDSAPDFFNDGQQQQQQGYESLSVQAYWDPDNAAFGEVQAYSGAVDPMQKPTTMQSTAGPPDLYRQPQHKMAGNSRNPGKQQQGLSQPWPVTGADASADVLWVEHRRSQEEQQQYRSQQQRRRQAATPQRRRPTMAELLATSEQVELFRRESYHEATKYAKLGAGVGKVQPQTGRRFVGGARLAPAEGPRLNTDRLWEELAQLQKARE